MPTQYIVKQGDCVSSIAYENGFFPDAIWNHPDNSDLKQKRRNPNVLMDGDTIIIPDKELREVSKSTDQEHKFKRKGVPERLNIKLLDYNHQPRTNLPYKIQIDGNWRKGKTDAEGKIREPIPPNATTGKLVFAAPDHLDASGKPVPGPTREQVMILELGNLNPISQVSGLKARLANLGFYKGPIDEKLDAATKQAISAFQVKQGLLATGNADDATRQKLLDVHGH